MDADTLSDIFQKIGPIRIRRMFGGQGLYQGDLIFGIVADGAICLKVDDGNRARFVAAGSQPFTYHRQGRAYPMSYWRMPDDALEDADIAADWARLAIAAAKRAAAGKIKGRKKA